MKSYKHSLTALLIPDDQPETDDRNRVGAVWLEAVFFDLPPNAYAAEQEKFPR